MPAATDAQLRDALKAADAAAVTAWNDTAASAVLMEHPPEPAAVVERRAVAELGVTIVRFANGVEAWFKPTDFKNDQVLFSLTRLGGASLAPTAVVSGGDACPALVELSGVGGHNCRRSPETARREDRLGAPVHLHVVSRYLGLEHAGEPRDRAAAAQSEFHGAGRRPAGVRAHSRSSSKRRTPTAITIPGCCSARNSRRSTPAITSLRSRSRSSGSRSSIRGDDLVLQGAFRECGRLHVLHGRGIQARRRGAARRALRWFAAVDRQGGERLQPTSGSSFRRRPNVSSSKKGASPAPRRS